MCLHFCVRPFWAAGEPPPVDGPDTRVGGPSPKGPRRTCRAPPHRPNTRGLRRPPSFTHAHAPHERAHERAMPQGRERKRFVEMTPEEQARERRLHDVVSKFISNAPPADGQRQGILDLTAPGRTLHMHQSSCVRRVLLADRHRRHARAERRYGGSWQEGGARAASPPLQGLTPPARRPRAAGAPWEARARAARVQTAGEDLWWVGGAHTNSELPQAGFT